jgi:histidine triad (HIT) family protein
MASTFTRIINRELPGEIVYEDEHAVAFLDLHPKAEGHTLVVPRQEVASFDDLPPEALTHLVAAVQKVARAVTRAMGTPHYNLSLNNGAPAGQVIFHVHFHIIPRREGVPLARPPLSPGNERLAQIGSAIRGALAEAGQADDPAHPAN